MLRADIIYPAIQVVAMWFTVHMLTPFYQLLNRHSRHHQSYQVDSLFETCRQVTMRARMAQTAVCWIYIKT